MSRLWPHLRAALIALHLLAITLLALPAPGGGMSKAAWSDPTVQAEIRAWSQRLSALGYETTPKALESRLWDLATAYMAARTKVLAPFGPYYRYAGTSQPWRMFVAPHRWPERMHVDVYEGGAWRPVYVERSSEATWLRPTLDHDRFRSAIFRFAWPQNRKTYRHFGEWLAARAAVDFPTATKLRTRFFKQRSPSAAEVRAGAPIEGRFEDEQILDLGKFR